MSIVPSSLVHQTEMRTAITQATRKLGNEVIRVTYRFGADSDGEPSIFFYIVLSDAASREEHLADVVGRIETILFDELRPHENWSLLPYFTFRSESEQATRNDPEWT